MNLIPDMHSFKLMKSFRIVSIYSSKIKSTKSTNFRSLQLKAGRIQITFFLPSISC